MQETSPNHCVEEEARGGNSNKNSFGGVYRWRAKFLFSGESVLHSTNLQGVGCFIIKALVTLLQQAFKSKSSAKHPAESVNEYDESQFIFI